MVLIVDNLTECCWRSLIRYWCFFKPFKIYQTKTYLFWIL